MTIAFIRTSARPDPKKLAIMGGVPGQEARQE